MLKETKGFKCFWRKGPVVESLPAAVVLFSLTKFTARPSAVLSCPGVFLIIIFFIGYLSGRGTSSRRRPLCPGFRVYISDIRANICLDRCGERMVEYLGSAPLWYLVQNTKKRTSVGIPWQRTTHWIYCKRKVYWNIFD